MGRGVSSGERWKEIRVYRELAPQRDVCGGRLSLQNSSDLYRPFSKTLFLLFFVLLLKRVLSRRGRFKRFKIQILGSVLVDFITSNTLLFITQKTHFRVNYHFKWLKLWVMSNQEQAKFNKQAESL